MKRVKKVYKLGEPIVFKDANRLLGKPANAPMTWADFQNYAASNNSSIKHK